jgi:uncharacterized protein (DUF2141 family)
MMMNTMKTLTKTLLSASVLAASLAGLSVAEESRVALTLEIAGVAPSEGFVMIGLYDSETSWESGNAVAGTRAEVSGDQVVAVFDDLPAGRYGVKMYHDVNANGEMDTNLMGIPSEPFAFSNNARGRFGPPNWDAAVFEVATDGTIHAIRFE